MILQALNGYYERLAGQPRSTIAPPGYSYQPISFVVVLGLDGRVVDVLDMRSTGGRRPQATPLLVPQPPKRSGRSPPPCFLWDKTGYVFGIERGEDGKTLVENLDYREAFRSYHNELLADTADDGLKALLAFLGAFDPSSYAQLRHAYEMADANVAFRLDGELGLLHERPEARRIWLGRSAEASPALGYCLVTGKEQPIARLHPALKAQGWQTMGVSIVSFNQKSFESYGKEQGANAPVSEQAAFAYTTALNALLARDSKQKVDIGDATTVFWAEAADPAAAEAAEALVGGLFSPPQMTQAAADTAQTTKLAAQLERLAQGRGLDDPEAYLDPATKFYILGLSPNAARLSVRFWEATTLGAIGRAFHRHWRDMHMEAPPPRALPPSVKACVLMTAPARKDKNGNTKMSFDDVSPLLAGELTRAILSEGRYPGALLTNLVMRIRTDHELTRTRIALVKAIILRAMRLDGCLPKRPDGSSNEDYLMRSDPDDPCVPRKLGRLFALLERAQFYALGDEINSTIKDKFIAGAATTPASVFVGLEKNSHHHTGRLQRGHSDAAWIKKTPNPSALARSLGAAIRRDIGHVWMSFDGPLPTQLDVEEQGLFFIGYYQERYGRPKKGEPDEAATDEFDFNTTESEEN